MSICPYLALYEYYTLAPRDRRRASSLCLLRLSSKNERRSKQNKEII